MSDGGTQFIPGPDAELGAWATQFWQTADGLVPGAPLPQSQVDEVEAALAEWLIAYPALRAARAAHEAASQTKQACRERLERAVRVLARTARSRPEISDADRAKFGICVRPPGGQPSRARPRSVRLSAGAVLREANRADAPGTVPLVEIKHIGVLTHTLRLADSATPTRRAFPKGAPWAEVWVSVGPEGSGHQGRHGDSATSGTGGGAAVPPSPMPGAQSPVPSSGLPVPGAQSPVPSSSFRFLQIATSATVRTTFDAADVGKQARYMLRWIGKGHAPGPWSAVASATVAA